MCVRLLPYCLLRGMKKILRCNPPTRPYRTSCRRHNSFCARTFIPRPTLLCPTDAMVVKPVKQCDGRLPSCVWRSILLLHDRLLFSLSFFQLLLSVAFTELFSYIDSSFLRHPYQPTTINMPHHHTSSGVHSLWGKNSTRLLNSALFQWPFINSEVDPVDLWADRWSLASPAGVFPSIIPTCPTSNHSDYQTKRLVVALFSATEPFS